jgi:hypothetical protein
MGNAKTNTDTANTEAAIEQAKVTGTEAKLTAKYGDKIVPGTVRRAPEGSKYGRKMLVDIRTRGLDGEYDGNTRTVATSDVFQVHHTDEVAKELRKQRMAEKRAARKAEKEAAEETKPKAKRKSKAKAKTEEAADSLGV